MSNHKDLGINRICASMFVEHLIRSTKDCNSCPYISIRESEQTSNKEPHVCRKYNKKLYHRGQHPAIPKLPECKEADNEQN